MTFLIARDKKLFIYPEFITHYHSLIFTETVIHETRL